MAKTMTTTNGLPFLISDEDEGLVLSLTCHQSGKAPHIYVAAWHQGRHVGLHRILMKAKRGEWVDHINGNTLDNRRENLRVGTPRQNQGNRKVNANSKTGVTGVFVNRNRYCAHIKQASRTRHLGRFETLEEAKAAREAAARAYFGDFASTRKNS